MLEDFIEYHKKNGGVSRDIKFEYFYRTLKNDPDPKKSSEYAISRYANICKEALLTCDLIPGVEEFLEHLNLERIICYVLSGGNEEEIKQIFSLRSLNRYFHGIYGSPVNKSENFQKLINSGIEFPILYFGDSELDFLTAELFGCDFVYVYSKSDWAEGLEVCRKKNVQTHRNFADLMMVYNIE